jgi:Protein of unknown function (DUF2752)
VLAYNPTDRIPDPTGPCTWHALFGIDGPGCGGTRMLWYLLTATWCRPPATTWPR